MKKIYVNRGNLVRNSTQHGGTATEPPLVLETPHNNYQGYCAEILGPSALLYEPQQRDHANDVDGGVPMIWLETRSDVVLDGIRITEQGMVPSTEQVVDVADAPGEQPAQNEV